MHLLPNGIAALVRHGAHAIEQRARLLMLLGSHVLPFFHPLQDLLLLVGRQRIEFLQTLFQTFLTIGWKLLKLGIVLECLLLLGGRGVQVFAKPIAEVRSRPMLPGISAAST